MDGYHMGEVVKIINIITVPIILTVPIKYFLTLGQSKLVSSLTSKPRELDRFRPCFYAY